MPPVLVLRHGESTWNVERRWQGWLDAPLTPAGEVQAAQRAVTIARDTALAPRMVVCSDLTRAQRTAEIIAAHLEVPVVPDPDLRERNGGEWQGRTADEIDRLWPGLRAAWRRGELASPPGGEDDDSVLARVDSAFARSVQRVGDNPLLVVTHHGVLRLLATRSGAPVDALIPNLGGFWFRADGHGRLHDPDPITPLPPDGARAAVE